MGWPMALRHVSMTVGHLRDTISGALRLDRAADGLVFIGVDPDLGSGPRGPREHCARGPVGGIRSGLSAAAEDVPRVASRLWTNSLLDRTDAIAAVQLAKTPEVFLPGTTPGRLFPRPALRSGGRAGQPQQERRRANAVERRRANAVEWDKIMRAPPSSFGRPDRSEPLPRDATTRRDDNPENAQRGGMNHPGDAAPPARERATKRPRWPVRLPSSAGIGCDGRVLAAAVPGKSGKRVWQVRMQKTGLSTPRESLHFSTGVHGCVTMKMQR